MRYAEEVRILFSGITSEGYEGKGMGKGKGKVKGMAFGT